MTQGAGAPASTIVDWEARGPASAPTVLLVPPLGRGRESWEPVLEALAESYRCLLFDPRGVGRSQAMTGEVYSAETLAEDAAAVMDADGDVPVHVVGWSLGAAAAAVLALEQPDHVTSLTLITPWARTDPHLATAFGVLHGLVARGSPASAELATLWFILSRGAVNAAGDGLAHSAQTTVDASGYPEPTVLAGYLDGAARFDVLERLPDLAVPTLVIGAAEDRLVDVDHAREVADAVPGATLRVIEGPGASHAVPVERAPEITALLRTFIWQHAAGMGQQAAGRP